MTSKVAIVGSGPTGIYTLAGLISGSDHFCITVFEVEADPGRGTPYHPDINDPVMLANIASIELPAIGMTLVEWLLSRDDEELFRLNVERKNIGPREFYPRVVLGDYLRSRFQWLVEKGRDAGHIIVVKGSHRVVDIRPTEEDIQVSAVLPDGERKDYGFDHVVMATGHDWPDDTEVKPGYFVSPWPAPALKKIGPCRVGILGTSLSGIDAMVSVATSHGAFFLDEAAVLQYRPSVEAGSLHFTMMSRKGLLPEADFYCDYPYRPLRFCTPDAIDCLVDSGSGGLLDRAFELFKQELADAEPDYAGKIGLSLLSADSFSDAYFREREAADQFVWSARNLEEAKRNKEQRKTVEWRYAILRMHEVFARIVPHLIAADLKRFHARLKTIFIDDYATVPHQSIERLLAVRRAGKVDILRLGSDYDIETEHAVRGAVVNVATSSHRFDAFIDATGQSSMSAADMPFPSLKMLGLVNPAATAKRAVVVEGEEPEVERTGGLDLDRTFRPIFTRPLSNNVYCASIPFLLHKLPFVQGITSAKEIGDLVSRAIRQRADSASAGFIISHMADGV